MRIHREDRQNQKGGRRKPAQWAEPGTDLNEPGKDRQALTAFLESMSEKMRD